MDRRVTVIRGKGDRTEKGAREGVNVRRGVDNDERGYRLILIMESVQVKRSIFPPAHVHPFSTPSPPLLLFPVTFRITLSSLFTPVVWICEVSRFQFYAISLPSFTSPADYHPPSDRSLFNIDFLSKGRKYRGSIGAALATVKSRRLSYTTRRQL